MPNLYKIINSRKLRYAIVLSIISTIVLLLKINHNQFYNYFVQWGTFNITIYIAYAGANIGQKITKNIGQDIALKQAFEKVKINLRKRQESGQKVRIDDKD